MQAERRKNIRIKKPLTALYNYKVRNKELWDMTTVHDIGETGLSITSLRQFKPDEQIVVLLKLPFRPDYWLETRCRVIVSQSHDDVFGHSLAGTYVTRLEFIELSDEYKNLIQVYIAWFLAQKVPHSSLQSKKEAAEN